MSSFMLKKQKILSQSIGGEFNPFNLPNSKITNNIKMKDTKAIFNPFGY